MRETSQHLLTAKRGLVASAILLSCSLGLCGVNLLSYSMLHWNGQGALILTGILELIGMLAGCMGILVFGLWLIVLSLVSQSPESKDTITPSTKDDQ